MTRVAAIVVICACGGSPSVPSPVPPSAPPRPMSPATLPAMSPTGGPLRASIEAPPFGNLHSIGVTPDGGAALTVDDGGGVRLWAALDGSREPRVVISNPPIAVALARRGDGFIAAEIDDGKGLSLVELDADGRTLGHRTLGNDPSVVGVASFEGGLLSWTSDQKIEIYDVDGVSKGALGTQPGERLVAIATAGTTAIAEVEVQDDTPHTRVRALTLAPTLAWGGFVDAGISPNVIALAPSGKRLAMIVGDATKQVPELIVIDIARNTKIADLPLVTPPAVAVAFADELHIVAASSVALMWFEQVGLTPTFGAVQTQPIADADSFAAGGGHLIAIAEGSLVVATPLRLAYLGYAIESPTLSVAGGAGTLMIASSFGTAALLDPQLRSRSVDLGTPSDSTPIAIAWLGADDWLVQERDAKAAGALRIGSVHSGASKIVATGAPSTGILRFDPSTQLVATAFGERTGVYRWDPAKRSLAELGPGGSPPAYQLTEIVPTAPDRADGVKLVRIVRTDKATIEWFTDDRMTKRKAVAEASAVLAVDAAGHVYTLARNPKVGVAILADGKEVGTLPLEARGPMFPDPTGQRVAVIQGDKVSLWVGDKAAWTIESPNTRTLVWLADGGLALVTAAGIARLDVATGAIVAMRCGWSFGLSSRPIPAPAIEPMCVRAPS